MEVIAYEVKNTKYNLIRITLTGRKTGRPRDYTYFIKAENAEAFADAVEDAVTHARYSTTDCCLLCGDYIYRQSRLTQLRDGRVVHTKCFEAAFRRGELQRKDCEKYYFRLLSMDIPLYDTSNLMTESQASHLRYAIQAVSMECVHLYLMGSYAYGKHHFCMTLNQCLKLITEIRTVLNGKS